MADTGVQGPTSELLAASMNAGLRPLHTFCVTKFSSLQACILRMVSLASYSMINHKCCLWRTSTLHVHNVYRCSFSTHLYCIGRQCQMNAISSRSMLRLFYITLRGAVSECLWKQKGVWGEVYSGFWNFLLSFLCFSGKLCLTPEPRQTNTCARRCSGLGRNGSQKTSL